MCMDKLALGTIWISRYPIVQSLSSFQPNIYSKSQNIMDCITWVIEPIQQ